MASILKVDTIQDQSGNNIINENADTITIGASGDTITIPSGATISNLGTATGFGGVSKPYFLATINSEQTVSDNVNTKVEFSNEIIDSDGCYDPSTNYRFTPTTAGKYYVSCSVGGTAFGADSLNDMEVSLYKNGSLYMRTRHNASNNYQYWLSPTVNAIVDMNGSTDYLEVYAQLDVVANTPRFYHSLYSWFMAHKLIG